MPGRPHTSDGRAWKVHRRETQVRGGVGRCFRECFAPQDSATVPCKRTIASGRAPSSDMRAHGSTTPSRKVQPASPASSERAGSIPPRRPQSSGAPSCLGLDEPRGQAFRERPDTWVTSVWFHSYEMLRGCTSGDKARASSAGVLTADGTGSPPARKPAQLAVAMAAQLRPPQSGHHV